MSETLKYIPINDITTNPNQPRKQFNQDEIISLAESIEKNGLIQPIIVRSSDIIGYELIAGERRLRAHQYLGKNNIKAIVTETKTDDSLKQALIENIQRTDLNPIEEALAFQNIIEKLKITHEELAKIIGKSRPYISNQLRLLQLDNTLKQALEVGEISSGHARLLLSLPFNEHQKWFQLIVKNNWSVHQLALELKKKPKSIQKKHSVFQENIEKQLQQALGVAVHISGFDKKKGRITIPFSTEEEFNRIIHNLK